MTGNSGPLRVAFLGGFSACFVEPVRARLAAPCELLRAEERDIVARMPEVDVLVSLAWTAGILLVFVPLAVRRYRRGGAAG